MTSTLRLRATVLTPLHVGNGDTLVPEDYLIRGDRLVRFNRSAVIRDMSPSQRRHLEKALDDDRFTDAQALLRDACDPDRHGLNRIGMGDDSRRELEQLVANPGERIRNREVHPFVYNPVSGRPYLPGSSLKGAIRTALVNFFTQQDIEAIEATVKRHPPQKTMAFPGRRGVELPFQSAGERPHAAVPGPRCGTAGTVHPGGPRADCPAQGGW